MGRLVRAVAKARVHRDICCHLPELGSRAPAVRDVVVRLFSEGGDGRGCTSSTSGFVAEVESELKLGVGRPQFAIEASSRRRGKSLCMLSARTPKRQKRIIGATAPGGAGKVQFRIAIRGAVNGRKSFVLTKSSMSCLVLSINLIHC